MQIANLNGALAVDFNLYQGIISGAALRLLGRLIIGEQNLLQTRGCGAEMQVLVGQLADGNATAGLH